MSNAGVVGRNRDSEPIAYLASLHAVKRSSGKCNTLSCDGPWRVYNTIAGKWRSLLMAGSNDEVYDKKHQRYAEDSVTQW